MKRSTSTSPGRRAPTRAVSAKDPVSPSWLRQQAGTDLHGSLKGKSLEKKQNMDQAGKVTSTAKQVRNPGVDRSAEQQVVDSEQQQVQRTGLP